MMNVKKGTLALGLFWIAAGAAAWYAIVVKLDFHALGPVVGIALALYGGSLIGECRRPATPARASGAGKEEGP